MKNPLKFLKREASAAEIEGIKTQTAELLAAAKSEISRLQNARRAILLDGSDRDAEDLENKIAAAAREVERLELTIGELDNRHTAAAAREEEEAHERKLQADRKAAARGAELVAAYATHATAIAEINEELLTIRQQIYSGNSDRAVAGYPERVEMMSAIEYLPAMVTLPRTDTQWHQIWKAGQRGIELSAEQTTALHRGVKPLANAVREPAADAHRAGAA